MLEFVTDVSRTHPLRDGCVTNQDQNEFLTLTFRGIAVVGLSKAVATPDDSALFFGYIKHKTKSNSCTYI